MKPKFFLPLFSVSTLLLGLVHASFYTQIVYDPTLTLEETYWLQVPWGEGEHNYTWIDGTAYLNVSESSGENWVGVKLMQGRDPHGWLPVAHLLRQEVTVWRGRVPDFFLNVSFKVGNYSVLKYPTVDPNGYAWFNVAVGLWFQRENLDYNSSQPHLCVGVNFFWMKYNGSSWSPQTGAVFFQGDLGNDFHSLFASDNQFVNGSWIMWTVNVKDMVETALTHWSADYATLKAVEFYVESLGAEGEVWVDHVEVYCGTPTVPPSPMSDFATRFIFACLPLFMLSICITVMKVMMGR